VRLTDRYGANRSPSQSGRKVGHRFGSKSISRAPALSPVYAAHYSQTPPAGLLESCRAYLLEAVIMFEAGGRAGMPVTYFVVVYFDRDADSDLNE
jgi:hypothetical protein